MASFCTKSFARLENNFLNISDIVYGSNVKPFSVSRQILVEGDLLSGKPNYFNVFQSFFWVFCESIHDHQFGYCQKVKADEVYQPKLFHWI